MEDGVASKGFKRCLPGGDGDGEDGCQDKGVCDGVGMECSVSILSTPGTRESSPKEWRRAVGSLQKITLTPTDAGYIHIHPWRHAHNIHSKVSSSGW